MVRTLIDYDLLKLDELRKIELVKIGYATFLHNEALGFIFDFNKYYDKETNCFNYVRATNDNCSLFLSYYHYIKSLDLQVVNFDVWKQYCYDMGIPNNFRIEIEGDSIRNDAYDSIAVLVSNHISDIYPNNMIVFYNSNSRKI